MRNKKKWPFPLRFLRAVLIFLVLLAAAWTLVSVIGRKAPGQVIPGGFSLYFRAPNPLGLAQKLSRHETLPEILALPEFRAALPFFNQLKDKIFEENTAADLVLRGNLEGAVYPDGSFLAAWDLGFAAPLLRVLPLVAGSVSVPNLYYVQAGKLSRFEFRMPDGKVFYIGPYRNLLIVSGDSGRFESVAGGTGSGVEPVGFSPGNYDAAAIFSAELLDEIIRAEDNSVSAALGRLRFDRPVEAALSVEPRQLDLAMTAALSSGQADIEKIIARNSGAPDLYRMVPENAQYLTLLAAGTLKEMLDAAAAVPDSPVTGPWKQADSSSRSLLGMGVDELLLSWSGDEFAAFGMEGRPAPVLVMEIRNERKRQEVFAKAFSSFVINENIQLNLDGTRIPRIELPAFLAAITLSMGIKIPSPYYTVYDGYLFVSESAESLLDAVNRARQNRGLLRTELWQNLAGNNAEASAITLFYSLDRSAPFFLRGDTPITPVLRLYRQGLLRLALADHEARLELSIIPGQGQGLAPVLGFPLEQDGKIGNQVYIMGPDKSGETRILFAQGNTAVAINPANQARYTLEVPGTPGRLWVIPADGVDGAIWVVNPQGRVYLCDRNLAPLPGFPRITALRLTAPPSGLNGKLYLSDYNGDTASIYTVDAAAAQQKLPLTFDAALLSPLSFLNAGSRTLAACYPKEFLGSIWLMDSGQALPGWPVPVSGIAFGSPLVFTSGNRIAAAFVTQAGELAVYDETGQPWPGFPLALDGIFYIQPVFDNENLWLVAGNGTLFRVSPDGSVLSHKIPDLEVREEGCLAMFDTDNDNRAEVFVSGEGNTLHGYSQNFNSLEGFPLNVWGRPAFVKTTGGKVQVAAAGMDNRVYFWQFR